MLAKGWVPTSHSVGWSGLPSTKDNGKREKRARNRNRDLQQAKESHKAFDNLILEVCSTTYSIFNTGYVETISLKWAGENDADLSKFRNEYNLQDQRQCYISSIV